MGFFKFIQNLLYGSQIKPNESEALIEQPSTSHFSSSTDPSDPSPSNPSNTAALKTLSTTITQGASNVPVTAVKHSPTRGFSFHSLAFLSNNDYVKPALSTVHVHKKEAITSAPFFKHQAKVPKADKQARDSALIVRSLIIGEASVYPASLTASGGISKPQLSKVKTQLMQPDSANKLIAQLRSLSGSSGQGAKPGAEHKPEGPIHAICLDTTDAEAEKRYFSRLTQEADADKLVAQFVSSPSVANASIDKVANMFKDMHIVSLIKNPDFGLGQPGDGDGILSGAVPTASTIINGVERITSQLMALGFMAGKAVLPDHKGRCRIQVISLVASNLLCGLGVCPPTDRISVLTCTLSTLSPFLLLHDFRAQIGGD